MLKEILLKYDNKHLCTTINEPSNYNRKKYCVLKMNNLDVTKILLTNSKFTYHNYLKIQFLFV